MGKIKFENSFSSEFEKQLEIELTCTFVPDWAAKQFQSRVTAGELL
jgi:hypothetical protein